ncbi:MAG TPA: septal ring lytic transglycosylase RlpA family protein [Solirubrobacteraceae bacterium]|nr:septal ring lytic transglycosylase RlpA family protein [Solirubrobacteraceae bacterium]
MAVLLASPLAAAPPVWASAEPSGGAASTAPSSTAPSGSGGASPVTQGTGAAAGGGFTTATGDGITVSAKASALLGHSTTFVGEASARSAGKTVALQRHDAHAGWVSVATGTVVKGGIFWVAWRTNYAGRVTMRTVLEPTAGATRTGRASPSLQITVYRPAVATFYGTGFFGKKTACGSILQPATLGVASRTLKCGTQVQLYYRGHTIVVPVIDRGPYANDATWDLTQATAQALGIAGTETVGAMPV